MHLRDPSGLLPVVGQVSTKLLTGAVVMPNTGHYKTEQSPSGAITGVEIAKQYENDLLKNTTA
jgi:dihydroorotase